MIKLFLEIFISFIRFIKIFLTSVSDPVSDPELADRPDRPTARSTVPRAGRPCGRPTCTELCTSGSTVGRPADRTRELCSLYLGGRPSGRPDCPTVTFMTVGGRPGRPTASLSGCQISLTASFLFGLYKPHFFGILANIFKAKISRLSLLF